MAIIVSFLNDRGIVCISHYWTPADCTNPKHCKKCGKEEGEPLGHKPSEWSEWDVDWDEATKSRTKICKVCEYTIDTQDETISSFVSDGTFSFFPHAFAERFDNESGGVNGYSFNSKAKYDEMAFFDEDNTIFYLIENEDDDWNSVGMYQFVKPDGRLVPVKNEWTDGVASEIDILIGQTFDVSAVVVTTVMAIDPSLNYNESFDVAQAILDSAGTAEGYTKNGINYVLTKDAGTDYLIVKVA